MCLFYVFSLRSFSFLTQVALHNTAKTRFIFRFCPIIAPPTEPLAKDLRF